MKRTLTIGVAILVTSMAGAAVVIGQGTPDRPQGVTADRWFPMGDKIGFVVLPPVAKGSPTVPPDRTVLIGKPPVEGFFMVKGKGGWSRIAITEPVIGPGGT